jgi:hypothetical protein
MTSTWERRLKISVMSLIEWCACRPVEKILYGLVDITIVVVAAEFRSSDANRKGMTLAFMPREEDPLCLHVVTLLESLEVPAIATLAQDSPGAPSGACAWVCGNRVAKSLDPLYASVGCIRLKTGIGEPRICAERFMAPKQVL